MRSVVLPFTLALTAACSLAVNDERIAFGETAIRLCSEQYVEVTGNPLPDFVDRAYIDAGEDAMELALTRGEVGTFGKRAPDYRVVVACRVDLKPRVELSRWTVFYPAWKSSGALDYQGLYDSELEEMLYLRDGDRFKFEASHPFSEERFNAIEFPGLPKERERRPPHDAGIDCAVELLARRFFTCEQVERGEIEVHVSTDETRLYTSVMVRERTKDLLEGDRFARCEFDAFSNFLGWLYTSHRGSRRVVRKEPVFWGPLPYDSEVLFRRESEEYLQLYEQYFGDWPGGREVAEVEDLERLERACRNRR